MEPEAAQTAAFGYCPKHILVFLSAGVCRETEVRLSPVTYAHLCDIVQKTKGLLSLAASPYKVLMSDIIDAAHDPPWKELCLATVAELNPAKLPERMPQPAAPFLIESKIATQNHQTVKN